MSIINSKVTKYEEFVNEQLKGDCRKLYEKEVLLLQERSDFELLENHLERILKDQLSCLDVSVDLGSSCFCDAHVPDTSKIFVDLGVGVFVELTLKEAIEFSKRKVAKIDAQIALVNENIAHSKAKIKFVAEGIRELMNLS